MKIRDILKSSVYFTPHFPSSVVKRHKISFVKLSLIILAYSFSMLILAIFLFTFTPMRDFLFWIENQRMDSEKAKIINLEERVSILTLEMNKMVRLNRKLLYSIQLAGIDSTDTNSAIIDSLREEPIKNKIEKGGYFLGIFENALEIITPQDSKAKSDIIFFISPIENGNIANKYNPKKNHFGVDFTVRQNTPVYSPANGYVIFAAFTATDGNVIIIQNNNSYRTVFKHCNALLKKEGEFVFQGELIALSGNSGYNTTGPHLHFEIWKNEKPLNPEDFIFFK